MNWLSSSILAIPYGPTLVGTGLRRTGSPSQTDLQQIASLMDDLPEFIYLTDLKGYRFMANTTGWTIRRSHGGLRQQIIRFHRRPTHCTRVRRWVCKRLPQVSTAQLLCMFDIRRSIGSVAGLGP